MTHTEHIAFILDRAQESTLKWAHGYHDYYMTIPYPERDNTLAITCRRCRLIFQRKKIVKVVVNGRMYQRTIKDNGKKLCFDCKK